MNDSNLIIIGANGQLGKALRMRFPDATAVSRDELDVADEAAVRAFDWSKYQVIVNAAAYTDVDGAETAEGRRAAWNANAVAVGRLSSVAIEHNLILVHISSEYVFDGTLTPHSEEEPFTPLGVYAQTKAAGDIAASITPRHYILRTSWVIGDGKNFVRTMIGLAEKNISPAVVSDQIGRLTFTTTLTDAISFLLHTGAPYGTYNVSNDGDPVSWAEITRAIFAELGRKGLTVTDTTTAEYYAGKPGTAPRPLQSTLDLAKIKNAGLKLPNWREDLHTYIAQ